MGIDNLIQRGDLNQRLTKALEIKGQKSPVLTLDTSVVPVVLCDDLTQQAQWTDPTRRLWASAQQAVAGGAANFNLHVISNPAGSGVLAVIHRISATAVGTNQQCVFGLIDPLAVPATPGPIQFLDRRIPGAPVVRCFTGVDTANRVVTLYHQFSMSTSVPCPWQETPGLVIQPGDTFGFESATANLATVFAIWGEEIPLA